MTQHVPVLLKEIIEEINVEKCEIVVDATVGGGGHLLAIVDRFIDAQKSLKIFAFDQDSNALQRLKNRLVEEGFEKQEKNEFIKKEVVVKIINSNFRDIESELKNRSVEKVDFILADLGISTDQLNDKSRGFSSQRGEKLDLRMNDKLTLTGADILNALYKKELENIFVKLADLKEAKTFANAIIKSRNVKPFESVSDLMKVIDSSIRFDTRNVKARIMQALRIMVNDELGSLKEFLESSFNLLREGGKLAVISFHSGEDRIVKKFFKEKSTLHKLIIPSEREIFENSKSSSAKLRLLTK